jgi:serine/threonine protein kinase
MVFPMVIQQSPRNENWKLSFDCYDAPIVGRGSSGTVFAIDQHLVFKSFTEDEEGQLDLERESSIYLQLQSEGFSQYIVRFVEVWEDGLVLERQGSSLRSCLRGKLQPMDKQRAQWVKETSNALAFLHKKGIMHGDVGCHNFLVDEWGHVKLCDFAGSARAGETARVCYEARGRHPDYRSGEPTPRTEIFSLVSWQLANRSYVELIYLSGINYL